MTRLRQVLAPLRARAGRGTARLVRSPGIRGAEAAAAAHRFSCPRRRRRRWFRPRRRICRPLIVFLIATGGARMERGPRARLGGCGSRWQPRDLHPHARQPEGITSIPGARPLRAAAGGVAASRGPWCSARCAHAARAAWPDGPAVARGRGLRSTADAVSAAARSRPPGQAAWRRAGLPWRRGMNGRSAGTRQHAKAISAQHAATRSAPHRGELALCRAQGPAAPAGGVRLGQHQSGAGGRSICCARRLRERLLQAESGAGRPRPSHNGRVGG